MVQLLERNSTAQVVRSFEGTHALGVAPLGSIHGTWAGSVTWPAPHPGQELAIVQPPQVTPELRQQPARFYIQGGLAKGYYLQVALPAKVWLEESDYVAEQHDLRLVGFGADETEALLQLGEALVEQLELLESMGEKLSYALARDREVLRSVLLSSANA